MGYASCQSLGIENQSLAVEINVYPNPVTTHVSINSSSTDLKGSQILLYDVTGKICLNKTLQDQGLNTISVEGIASGIYTLELRNATTVSHYKLLKR